MSVIGAIVATLAFGVGYVGMAHIGPIVVEYSECHPGIMPQLLPERPISWGMAGLAFQVFMSCVHGAL